MRLLPASLGGRLLAGAAVFVTLALVAAAVLIGLILQQFVTDQLDQRLDSQMVAVADALQRNSEGKLVLSVDVDGPPFDRLASGWYWQASGEGVDLRSKSLGNGSIDVPPHRFEWRELLSGRGSPAEGTGPRGESLHLRTRTMAAAGQTVTLVVSAPREALLGPMKKALVPLLGSLIAIGVGLLLASFLQVRLGLRPLRHLQASLREIRAGRAQHVSSDQPDELRPLVDELNALIDQNAQGLAAARRHVANLAHGLKTPLATLAMELSEPGADPTGSMKPLVERIEGSIRHHLARARAGALGASGRVATPLLPRCREIASVLGKIHADRNVEVVIAGDATLTVACEMQDLDEMLGNLLDNAFKWARSRVSLAAVAEGQFVVVRIEDNGVGLAEERLPDVLLPGRRLDEAMPGHGFGLSITRELAELYGGSLVLRSGPPGGLTAILTLPIASP
ncbi:MAG TPA: HAMP domain-containing sensor histidine kinase [Kaistia sp.]|nr:HAMP domain-containing sensor histidine kinase [Kaistia sp.]